MDKSVSSLEASSRALQGLALGMILVFLSAANFQIGGQVVNLSFIPLAAILLWPGKASYSWSLFALFLLGMFRDVLADIPTGFSSLIYIGLFVIIGGAVGRKWTFDATIGAYTACVVAVGLAMTVLGRVFLGSWPNATTLIYEGIFSIVFFPLIYWIRSWFLPTDSRRSTNRVK